MGLRFIRARLKINANKTPNIIAGMGIILVNFFLLNDKNAFSNTLHLGVRTRSRSFGSLDRCKNYMRVMVVTEVVIVVVVLGVLVTGGVNGAKAEQIRFVQRVFKSRFFFFFVIPPRPSTVCFLKNAFGKSDLFLVHLENTIQ